MATYTGYSSHNIQQNGSLRLTDVELVKRDILNHIYTRPGERRGMPGYGTIIPNVPFEQMDEFILDNIYSDVERVLDSEPRVITLELEVLPFPDNNAIVVTALLQYVELNVVDALQFDIPSGGIVE